MGAKTLENFIQIYEGGVSKSGSVKTFQFKIILGGGNLVWTIYRLKFCFIMKHKKTGLSRNNKIKNIAIYFKIN